MIALYILIFQPSLTQSLTMYCTLTVIASSHLVNYRPKNIYGFCCYCCYLKISQTALDMTSKQLQNQMSVHASPLFSKRVSDSKEIDLPTSLITCTFRQLKIINLSCQDINHKLQKHFCLITSGQAAYIAF